MSTSAPIPVFSLFGETGTFPDVVHCERIIDRARGHDWTISPHRHREMSQVFFMRKGQAQVQTDGHRPVLEDNHFLFIPAQVVHGFAFRQGSEGLVLSFPQVLVTPAAGEAALARQLSQPFGARADREAAFLMDHLVRAFKGSDPFRASLLVGISQALFAHLAGLARQQGAADVASGTHHMPAFDRLIAQHLADGWGVSDYAQALSITAGHLNRLCHAATGQNAARHIEVATMTEACRLLAFTRLPVAEVGYRLGYADPSYFSRRFRVIRGIAPSDYRNRLPD